MGATLKPSPSIGDKSLPEKQLVYLVGYGARCGSVRIYDNNGIIDQSLSTLRPLFSKGLQRLCFDPTQPVPFRPIRI
jgi:hypothetical protein